jgi:hypothetical protein
MTMPKNIIMASSSSGTIFALLGLVMWRSRKTLRTLSFDHRRMQLPITEMSKLVRQLGKVQAQMLNTERAIINQGIQITGQTANATAL